MLLISEMANTSGTVTQHIQLSQSCQAIQRTSKANERAKPVELVADDRSVVITFHVGFDRNDVALDQVALRRPIAQELGKTVSSLHL